LRDPPLRPAEPDLPRLVDLLNEREGSSWELVRKLPGGYNRGAYELREREGTRAVLKWRPPRDPTELEDTAELVRRARAAGWSTPRWIAYGVVADGDEYVIEELIAGARTATAADADLSLIARNNRLQAGLAADRRRDWSRHIWRVIFETDPTVEARLEALPATAVVLDRVRALSRDLREVALPTSDLVHGDCVQDNVLIKDGTAYLIDAEHCGKGPRAHDLATLLFEATVGGHPLRPSTAGARSIAEECIAQIGREGLLLCVISTTIEFLAFGLDHWTADVPNVASRCGELLSALGSD